MNVNKVLTKDYEKNGSGESGKTNPIQTQNKPNLPAAFLATGVTLVGVSYLYQFLRKKGFFDSLLVDKSENQ